MHYRLYVYLKTTLDRILGELDRKLEDPLNEIHKERLENRHAFVENAREKLCKDPDTFVVFEATAQCITDKKLTIHDSDIRDLSTRIHQTGINTGGYSPTIKAVLPHDIRLSVPPHLVPHPTECADQKQ